MVLNHSGRSISKEAGFMPVGKMAQHGIKTTDFETNLKKTRAVR
jgi:hypothetical protein